MRNLSLVLGFEGVIAAKVESGYFLRPYLKEFVKGVKHTVKGIYVCSNISPAAVVKSVLAKQGVSDLFDGVFGIDDIERDAGRIYEGIPPARIQKLPGDPFIIERCYYTETNILKELAWLGFRVMDWARAAGKNAGTAEILNALDVHMEMNYVYGEDYEEYKGGMDDGYLMELKQALCAGYQDMVRAG